VRLRSSYLVKATPDRVFAYLSDPRNAMRDGSRTTVDLIRPADSDDGIGATYQVTVAQSNTSAQGVWQVEYLEFERPVRLVTRTSGDLAQGTTLATYRLEPHLNGARVHTETEFHLGVLRTLSTYVKVATGQSRRTLEAGHERMAQAIEDWARQHPT